MKPKPSIHRCANMSIKQTFESIYETLKERIGNPFMGSTLLAWPIINYKFLIVALSDGKFIEKVYFIETYVYPNTETRLLYIIGLPAAIGLFYTLIYPFVDIGLTIASKLLFNLKQKMVLAAERKTPIDSREQAEFFGSYDRKVKKMEEAFSDQTQRHIAQFSEANKVQLELIERLNDQCLRRLSDGTGLKPTDIQGIAFSEPTTLSQGSPSVKERARSSAHLKGLIELLEQLNAYVEFDDEKGRVTNLPALAQEMNIEESELLASMELIQAMNLVKLGPASPVRTVEVTEDKYIRSTIANLRFIFSD